jgi:ribose-phosphate pyrophosphokinase
MILPKNLEMKIFTGNAHPALAGLICDYLNVGLGNASVSSFPDGETYVKINDNIRGRDVFIIQPTCPPTSPMMCEASVSLALFRFLTTMARLAPRAWA